MTVFAGADRLLAFSRVKERRGPMTALRIRLFGRFEVRHDGRIAPGLHPRKSQELFAYLLLHNDRPHSREILANLMWPRSTTQQARKYLRHTLWQLQSALDPADRIDGTGVLSVDHDWLQINPQVDVWLDTAELERAYLVVQGISGREFDSQQSETVQQALALYRGDLLEGWYDDWCLFERERLQRLYLALLGKQMIYCEMHGDYELGLDCGNRALQCDVAYERIHRRMMRLHYLAGDRTGALRQYQRCVAFLREELDVEPSARTLSLYDRIRSGRPLTFAPTTPERPEISDQRLLSVPEALEQLEQLQTAFLELQCQFQEAVEAFESAASQRG
jgi:DNA-binding SARP family transcriptional activator